MQVAERLAALKAACAAVEGTSTGKGGEARLRKALAKLQKIEEPLTSQPQSAAPASAAGVAAPEAAAAAPEPQHGSAAAPAQMEAPLVSSPAL